MSITPRDPNTPNTVHLTTTHPYTWRTDDNLDMLEVPGYRIHAWYSPTTGKWHWAIWYTGTSEPLYEGDQTYHAHARAEAIAAYIHASDSTNPHSTYPTKAEYLTTEAEIGDLIIDGDRWVGTIIESDSADKRAIRYHREFLGGESFNLELATITNPVTPITNPRKD